MKVLHTISSLGIRSGGPTLCVWNLVKEISNRGIDINLLTFEPRPNDQLISNEDIITTVKSPLESRYGYSSFFKKALTVYKDSDVIHANALWQYSSHCSARFSRKMNIPCVISTHGMLYPEALNKSYLVKKAGLVLFQRKDLNLATVIHATCIKEKDYIKELGFKSPVAVIPNSISTIQDGNAPKPINDKITVGFVGRFVPIKNIEHLLHAWAITGGNRTNCELLMIGDGDLKYVLSLKALASKLQITNIRFTGFLAGKDKDKALVQFSYLVLPSKSENFGMVVPEALTKEIPVIASKGTPWEELSTHHAGWWIDIGVEPLARALKEALSLPENERRLMGKNGRKLVEQKYSIDQVARQMITLYEWILGKGPRPDFVYI